VPHDVKKKQKPRILRTISKVGWRWPKVGSRQPNWNGFYNGIQAKQPRTTPDVKKKAPPFYAGLKVVPLLVAPKPAPAGRRKEDAGRSARE
jgi:hypothetical protein